MGGATAKKIFPTDTKSLIATAATFGAYNALRTAGQVYKETDPLGSERQKKQLQQKQDEAEQRQRQEAAAQEERIRTAPRRVAPDEAQAAQRRFRAGFAATIRTSPLGVAGPGPSILKPTLGQ